MDHMKFETPDLTAQNIEKIAALFPGCVTEGPDGKGGLKKAVNFELLKQMLSDDVLEGDEAYEFTWVGKKASIVEANKPIRKTLRPCPEESKNWDTTENLYIEGDNLEVLKLLQEAYLGKVKMIYIDPPYNTGHDFIYEAPEDDSGQHQDQKGQDRVFAGQDHRENHQTAQLCLQAGCALGTARKESVHRSQYTEDRIHETGHLGCRHDPSGTGCLR